MEKWTSAFLGLDLAGKLGVLGFVIAISNFITSFLGIKDVIPVSLRWMKAKRKDAAKKDWYTQSLDVRDQGEEVDSFPEMRKKLRELTDDANNLQSTAAMDTSTYSEEELDRHKGYIAKETATLKVRLQQHVAPIAEKLKHPKHRDLRVFLNEFVETLLPGIGRRAIEESESIEKAYQDAKKANELAMPLD